MYLIKKSIILSLSAAFFFVACGNSTTSSNGSKQISQNTRITVVDGYIKNATVIDSSTPAKTAKYLSAYSSNLGTYEFEGEVKYPIISKNGTLVDTNESFKGEMKAHEGNIISPITTYINSVEPSQRKKAIQNLKKTLNTNDDIMIDYIEKQDLNINKLAQVLYIANSVKKRATLIDTCVKDEIKNINSFLSCVGNNTKLEELKTTVQVLNKNDITIQNIEERLKAIKKEVNTEKSQNTLNNTTSTKTNSTSNINSNNSSTITNSNNQNIKNAQKNTDTNSSTNANSSDQNSKEQSTTNTGSNDVSKISKPNNTNSNNPSSTSNNNNQSNNTDINSNTEKYDYTPSEFYDFEKDVLKPRFTGENFKKGYIQLLTIEPNKDKIDETNSIDLNEKFKDAKDVKIFFYSPFTYPYTYIYLNENKTYSPRIFDITKENLKLSFKIRAKYDLYNGEKKGYYKESNQNATIWILADNNWYFIDLTALTPFQVNKKIHNKKIEIKIDEIIASLKLNEKNDYNKIKAVHDWIVENVVYGYKEGEAIYSNSAYGALINNIAVCEGYSKAFNMILRKIGFEASSLRGYNGLGFHEWSLVKLNGKYYHIDTTADTAYKLPAYSQEQAKKIKYKYFLRGNRYMRNENKAIHPGSSYVYNKSERSDLYSSEEDYQQEN